MYFRFADVYCKESVTNFINEGGSNSSVIEKDTTTINDESHREIVEDGTDASSFDTKCKIQVCSKIFIDQKGNTTLQCFNDVPT